MADSKYSQIKYNRMFMEKLLSKLTVGNGRSIHINAIVGNKKTRIDASDLPKISEFMEFIFSRDKFSIDISIDVENTSDDEKHTARRMDAIVADNEDMFLETGIKNFGFGYPLLIKKDAKDSKKFIVAPIFIWSLDITKSNRKNHWIISKNPDSPIKVNELLISHLNSDMGISIEKLSSDELDDNILSQDEVLQYISNLSKQLNINSDVKDLSINRVPTRNEILSDLSTQIYFGGVFGLYRSQKESIIESLRQLIENIDEYNSQDVEITPFQKFTTASFDVDPSQSEIIDTLNNDEFKIIQGPPGTGKSQALSAIISNALANGAKTLVVCEKKTALDVLANNMMKKNLGTFCAVIDDATRDRREIVSRARDLVENNPTVKKFDKTAFENQYKRFIEIRNRVNGAYNASSAPIFGGESFGDIVGKYLTHSSDKNCSSIINATNSMSFAFTPDEFSCIADTVNAGAIIYNDVADAKNNPFYMIDFSTIADRDEKNDVLSRINTSMKIISDAREKIATYNNDNISLYDSDVLNQIKSDLEYISGVDGCNASPDEIVRMFEKIDNINKQNIIDNVAYDNHAPDKIRVLSQIIKLGRDIVDNYESGIKIGGKKFDNKNIGMFNRLFSGTSVSAQKYINDTAELYRQYRFVSDGFLRYFDLELNLKPWDSYATITDTVSDVTRATASVKKWRDKIYQEIQTICDKFKSLIQQISTASEIKQYISDTNQKIFAQTPGIKIATNNDDMNGYKNALDRAYYDMQIAIDNIHDIKKFAKWARIHDKYPILFDALMCTPTETWHENFIATYYYHLLTNFMSVAPNPPMRDDSDIKILGTLYNQLQEQNINMIYNLWHDKRDLAIKKLESNYGFNAVFALKKNQKFGRRLSLRKIIDLDFDAFTTLFPVLMVNPIVANAILPLVPGQFDIVIFDEASQLRIEDVFTSMIRGKYKIIAGDKHQMPPSNYFAAGIDGVTDDTDDADDTVDGNTIRRTSMLDSESLLEFSEFIEHKNTSYLDFHYRSKHPDLINFSNAAFYGGNLCPLPVMGPDYQSIVLYNVNGVYSGGKSKNINQMEAARVIEILKQIEPIQDGTYPSIGVATFNIHQRNLIREMLYAAAYDDKKFAEKLNGLQSAGLFIKNLENIQGDERDIMIISTTFGRDESGRFYERFASIGRDNGYKLLNVLVTRAKRQMYVITSIPREKYMRYHQALSDIHENNKKAILYAYLAYADALSNNNRDAAHQILTDLYESSYDKPRSGVSNIVADNKSTIHQIINDALTDIAGKNNVQSQYHIGGYVLNFAVLGNDKKIAIECDDNAYYNSPQAYTMDIQRQKWIEQFGYKYYRTWSANWFDNAENEKSKLARQTN